MGTNLARNCGWSVFPCSVTKAPAIPGPGGYKHATKDPDEIKAKVAELQALRKAAQPTNKRTFGSVFKNPEHELTAGRMLEACGLKGHRIGGAQISPRHANFIENADGARAADAIALMAEARRRAHEQYGVALEHEVQFVGPLELPPLDA